MRAKYTVLLCLLLITGSILANSGPVRMLEAVSDEIITALQQNESKRADLAFIYQLVETVLLPHIDTEGMARSAIGREVWRASSSSQRRRFSEALIQLVIRTYSKALTEYSNETVKFYPLRGKTKDKRFVQVKSLIVRKKANSIPLTYSLVLKDNRWEIYDLSVEGVSLLQSFKTQFAAELAQGSLEDLIDKITKHDVRPL